MGVDDQPASSGSHPAPRQAPLPHYALPNFSVVLPTYSNAESDLITQAFRIGNFVSVSALPNSIKPGQVSRSRFQKILDNRQPAEDWNVNLGAPYKPKQKTFSEFEYMPSPFSLADEVAKEDREKHVEATKAAGHEKAFVMSDTHKSLKYEDSFRGGSNPTFQFNAFSSVADPYERADDQALRYKWLQDAQILAGPIRPSGRVKGSTGQASSELPTRSTLPQMVAELREAIEFDWSEYAFLVCSTDDEHVVIRFELATLDSEPGLSAYMNVFSRSHRVVYKYMLKKVVEDWNVTPGDGHLYFTFRPPWVASRITDTFYSLHPEQRTYQDSRAKRSAKAASTAGAVMGASSTGLSSSSIGGPMGAVERPDLT